MWSLLCPSVSISMRGLPSPFTTAWSFELRPELPVWESEASTHLVEAYLERKFSDVYRSYRSRVRRWL